MLRVVKMALCAGLFTMTSGAIACTVASAKIDPELLTSGIWATTGVYEEHDCSKNVIDKYPDVVGISSWDKDSNRFEYFNPETGKSRRSLGGAGYFFITGDKTKQINVFDSGTILVRTLEELSPEAFTYSRMVPQGMQQQNPQVKIFVVHTPYKGTPVLHQ